jgi:hypothetical protein
MVQHIRAADAADKDTADFIKQQRERKSQQQKQYERSRPEHPPGSECYGTIR